MVRLVQSTHNKQVYQQFWYVIIIIIIIIIRYLYSAIMPLGGYRGVGGGYRGVTQNAPLLPSGGRNYLQYSLHLPMEG